MCAYNSRTSRINWLFSDWWCSFSLKIRENRCFDNYWFFITCSKFRSRTYKRLINRSWKSHAKRRDFVESYWLTKEWIANCCLSNLDEKFISLYKNSFSTISSTDLSSHDSSRSLWESRSSIVTRLFSSDQDVFELRSHFDLISSESHTHLRALWLLDDLENQ
jgi:hypothetical protein